MSKLIRCKQALERFHKRTEDSDYFYLNAQTLIDELNELLEVEPASLPVITIEETQYL